MKSQLRAIVVAAAMLGNSAMAADYPIYPVNAPLYRPPVRNMLFSWTGCYGGVNLGAKWGNRADTIELAAVPFPGGTIPSFSVPLQGQSVGSFVGGGQVGCNYQIGNVVLGIEGDADGQHWDSGRQFGVLSTGVFGDSGVGTPPTTLEALSRWQASLRGRIGYAWDRTLIYVTGGISWTNVRVCSNPGAFLFPLATPGCDSQTFPGGTIGGGVEHAILASNWSIAVEGRYTNYGSHSFNTGSLITTLGPFPFLFSPLTDNLKLYTVEALFKLNYRFGGGPVFAAY
jgi:outer membrane immunogenic protein